MQLTAIKEAIGIEPYYEEPAGVIYCADCLDILPKIPEKSIDLVVTSPPYNMRTRIRNGEYTERERGEHFSKKYKYFHDALPISEYYKIHKSAIRQMLRISKIVFWNIGVVTGSKEAVFKLIGDFNKELKDIIVWDKGWAQPAMHNSVINRGTELILALEDNAMAGRAFRKSYFPRGTMEDIWRLPGSDNNKEHNASFPIELPARAINGWTKEDDIIVDPFAGLGTTGVGAKKLGRRFILIEIEEKYCKIAVQRLSQEILL